MRKNKVKAYERVPSIGDLHRFVFGYNDTVLCRVISVDEKEKKFRVKALESCPFEEVVLDFAGFNYAGR